MRIPEPLKTLAGIALFATLLGLSFAYPVIEKAWIIGFGLFLLLFFIAAAGGVKNFVLLVGSFVLAIATVQTIDRAGSRFGLWVGLRSPEVLWSGRDALIHLGLIGFAVWLWMKVGDALFARYGQNRKPDGDAG